MDITGIFHALCDQARMKRMETQMTLGEMISSLASLPAEAEVYGLGELGSYRGYYEDLAFAPTDSPCPAHELYNQCLNAIGKVFVGYKGGDYTMTKATPLWLAEYGDCSGLRVMGLRLRSDGSYEAITSREEDDDE